jgi:hypothetical protein
MIFLDAKKSSVDLSRVKKGIHLFNNIENLYCRAGRAREQDEEVILAK